MIKQKLQLEDSKHYLKPNQIIFKSQQKIESETHNVFTEKVDDVTEKKKSQMTTIQTETKFQVIQTGFE